MTHGDDRQQPDEHLERCRRRRTRRRAAGRAPCSDAHAVPSSRGRARRSAAGENSSSGTTTSTQATTTTRAHGFSAVASGPRPPGDQTGQDRPDALVEVGDAGEVGEDVVAVEPHAAAPAAAPSAAPGWRRAAGRRPTRSATRRRTMATRDERVEVQPAEVGPHPPRPAEPVAVGDVGVERRPEQVDARRPWRPGSSRRSGQPAAWPNSWKPADSTVTPTTARNSAGLPNASAVAAARPFPEQHPAGDGDEGEHDRHDDERVEEHGERGRDPAGDRRVGDHPAEAQRRAAGPSGAAPARVPSGRRSSPSGRSEESSSCRTSSGADEAAGRVADRLGDLGDVRRPSTATSTWCSSGRQLDDLAVRAADQRGRPAVAGALHLAEELDAVGPGRHLGAGARPAAGRPVAPPRVVMRGRSLGHGRTAGRQSPPRSRRCPA